MAGSHRVVADTPTMHGLDVRRDEGAPTTPHVSGWSTPVRRTAMLPLLLASAPPRCSSPPCAVRCSEHRVTSPLVSCWRARADGAEIVPSGTSPRDGMRDPSVARLRYRRRPCLHRGREPNGRNRRQVADDVVRTAALHRSHAYAACIFYAGTGLPNGTGIDSSARRCRMGVQTGSPSADSGWPLQGGCLRLVSPAADRSTSRIPTRSRPTWVIRSTTRHWCRARPPAFDGSMNNALAPFPLLQAYDAHHHLVAAQYAPRVVETPFQGPLTTEPQSGQRVGTPPDTAVEVVAADEWPHPTSFRRRSWDPYDSFEDLYRAIWPPLSDWPGCSAAAVSWRRTSCMTPSSESRPRGRNSPTHFPTSAGW